MKTTLEDHNRRLDRITPPRIRTTDTAHRDFNRELWERVKDWQPTEERPWLGLVGDTGTAKTRTAYLAARAIAESDAEAGRDFSPAWIDGPAFSRLVMAQFRGNDSERYAAAEDLENLRGADVLIFDELGKVHPSAATVAEAFALIDYRHARNLLTLWTANRMPQAFCATWGEEHGAPSAARIVEASTTFAA